ncbi:hypothetical protein OG256_45975 (plasmid) [Streptomyces sp. NBC_00564]|nr:hypothetical protein OG256_45975 [Streptomyces sp. NBC_00564]
MRWAARLTPCGHDTLTYAQSRPQPPITRCDGTGPEARRTHPIADDDAALVRPTRRSAAGAAR